MSDVDEGLAIDRRDADGVVTFVLDGDLDPHTAPVLHEALSAALDEGAGRIVLDLARLRFVDSSGLRVMIWAHKEVERRDGELALRHPSANTMRLLEITDLVNQFRIEQAQP